MYRILIVGCGQIGSRHLQAVATLSEVHEIEVFDPRPEALVLGQERLTQVSDRVLTTTYRWVSTLQDITPDGDLCIIATQAKDRATLVEQVVACGYHTFILEKVVTQSIVEYEQLLTLAKEKDLRIWVNCKSRVHPIWKYIKSKLEPGEPLIYNSMGGNHGLGNNGVHMVDLFVFFNDNNHIESVGSRIDPILHLSKRGQSVYDLSGTLHGYSKQGSHFTLTYASNHVQPPSDIIMTNCYHWVVDQMTRQAFEGDASDDWALRPIPFEGNLMISQMTKGFAMDILQSGQCELPTLAECFPAHRFIFSELLPVFNQLLNKDDDQCPVT